MSTRDLCECGMIMRVGMVATSPPGGRLPPGESCIMLRSHRFRRITLQGSRCVGQKKYFDNMKQEFTTATFRCCLDHFEFSKCNWPGR